MNCRFCHNPLTHLMIDLGHAPLSNAYLTAAHLEQAEYYFPLKVYVCGECLLAQTSEYKRPEDIFRADYAYFSSYSTTWLRHAQHYTEMIIPRLGLTDHSQVIEIASNDGYLLQYFQARGIPVLGIEPAAATAAAARKKSIETIETFFGVNLAKKMTVEGRSADLLIGNNVLAHVPDINDFVAGLKLILKINGVITLEFPHIMRLLAECQFDTIYHEHFSYFSLLTVQHILTTHGLTIFDVEELPTHGGSLRIFVKHTEDSSKALTDNVQKLLTAERQNGLESLAGYRYLQHKADTIKNELLAFLIAQKQAGKKVCAYGAAAKGNTLLNYAGVKKDLILFVTDRAPSKQGKFLPGSHIPILGEDAIRQHQPDWILILPWNIKAEVMEQLNYARNWGARYVISIPHLEIL